LASRIFSKQGLQTGAVPEAEGQIGPFTLLSEIRGINTLKVEIGLDKRFKLLIG
jgi:hypothetical protein